MASVPNYFYKRNLPHYHPPYARFFVVARLFDSLPIDVIDRLRFENEEAVRKISVVPDSSQRALRYRQFQADYFRKFDTLLDNNASGPSWLLNSEIASMVANAIRFKDGKDYDLWAYTIMPNHIHIVLDRSRTADFEQKSGDAARLLDILAAMKSYTAHKANEILGRSGAFWQHESYDHVIRNDEELERAIWYVLMNPVKARLVDSWEKWPWTYCKEGV